MSEIALYNTLRKIPDVTEAEAREAVADVASSKETATKADLKSGLAEVKADIANLEIRLIKQMYAVGGIVIAAISIIVAVFGLIIKFL